MSRTLRVVTFNIFSKNSGVDHRRITDQIRVLSDTAADVICLQEVWHPEVIERFVRGFPDHKPVHAGQMMPKPISPIRHLASAVAAFFAMYFYALPRLWWHPTLYPVAYLLSTGAVVLAMCTLPKRAHAAILAVPALLGFMQGCRMVAAIFAFLIFVFQHQIFLWWLNWSGVAPIAWGIAHGDPFGLLMLVRADSPAKIVPVPSSDAALTAQAHHMRYRQQGYLLAGGPWLFWAGWFEGTFLCRGAVAVECSVRGERVRIVDSHLANGVHNTHRLAQCAELMHFAKPRAGACTAAAASSPSCCTTGARAGPAVTLICCDANADASEPEMRWLRKTCFIDTFLAHWGLSALDDHDTVGRGSSKNTAQSADREGELRSCTPHGGNTWDNANTFATTGNLLEPDQRMDFVWLLRGSKGRVVDSQIIGDDPPISDHYGVFTTIALD